MKARSAALLLAVALGAETGIAACGEPSEAERFIQGNWSYSGTVPGEPIHRPVSIAIEWSFASGRFRQSGYPPLLSEGRYRVVRADADAITLTLFAQKGHFSEADRTIRIDLDRTAKSISVDRGPALRRKPK